MAKLKSSFKNMLISLTCIALVAAAALAGVYLLTKGPIDDAMKKKQEEAIIKVLPQIEGIKIAKVDTVNGLILHKAYVGDEWVGTAVEASTEGNKNMPFGSNFKLMVGFDKEGNVVQYEVLEQSETPGLGAQMGTWFNNTEKPNQCIIGKNPVTSNFSVSKDGGDIDAITASTITSRAFLEVVVKAYNAITGNEVAVTSATVCEQEQSVCNEQESSVVNKQEVGVCPNGNDPATCPGCPNKFCQQTQEGGQQ